MSIEEEIVNRAGAEMSREIDREILWGMLQGLGWTRVMLPRLQDNRHAIDITHWLEQHAEKGYERRGRDFIFEDTNTASHFILKWC